LRKEKAMNTKKNGRRLVLSRETVRALQASELRRVAGGNPTVVPPEGGVLIGGGAPNQKTSAWICYCPSPH
jgi:hypothetical protein